MGKRRIFVFIAILILLSTTAIFAETTSTSTDSLFDDLENISPGDGYLKYHDNYFLDAEKKSFFKEPLGTMFLALANLLFMLEKGMGELAVSLVSFTFGINIFNMLETALSPLFANMKTFVFNGFALIAISIAGFFFIMRILQRRTAQVLTEIVQLILVITFALIFYAYPIQIVGGINDVTTELSGVVLDAPYASVQGSTATTGDATQKSATLIWNVMVHTPWQLLEFGSVSEAEKDDKQGQILRLTPGSEDRQELVDQMASGDLFSIASGAQLSRISTALILLIFQLVLFIVIVGFCILIIGYQFLTLFLCFLGIFIFLLALIPYFGMNLLKKWALKIFAASAVKIGLVFCLALIFVITDYIYGLSSTYGLLSVLFIIVAMLTVIMIKRKSILDTFSGYSGGGMNNTVNRLMDKDFNSIAALRQARQGMSSMRSMGDDTGTGKTQTTVINTKTSERQANATLGNDDIDTNEMSSDLKKLSAISSEHYKKAEELLEKNYESSKRQSEERATKNGGEPEYTDFVKRTMAVRDLGAGDFDERDKIKTASIVRNVEARGGNPDELLRENTMQKQERLERPANVIDLNSRRQEVPLDDRQPERTKRGQAYFKESFGEEKGEMVYSQMTSRYGEERVNRFGADRPMKYSEIHQKLREDSIESDQVQLPPKRVKVEPSEKQSLKTEITIEPLREKHIETKE